MSQPPVPFPQPQLTTGQKTARFFLGIGLGFVPILIALAIGLVSGAVGGDVANVLNTLVFLVPCGLGLALLGLMIYFLTQPRFRFIGYGLLTVIVALPIIAAVSCIVLLTRSSV